MQYLELMFIFGVLWLVQAFLTYKQQTHIRRTMSDAQKRFKTGYLGFGINRSKYKIGSGAFALMVVDENNVVQELQTLSGISIFNRFRNHKDYVNESIFEIEKHFKNKKIKSAITNAIEQINITKNNVDNV